MGIENGIIATNTVTDAVLRVLLQQDDPESVDTERLTTLVRAFWCQTGGSAKDVRRASIGSLRGRILRAAGRPCTHKKLQDFYGPGLSDMPFRAQRGAGPFPGNAAGNRKHAVNGHAPKVSTVTLENPRPGQDRGLMAVGLVKQARELAEACGGFPAAHELLNALEGN